MKRLFALLIVAGALFVPAILGATGVSEETATTGRDTLSFLGSWPSTFEPEGNPVVEYIDEQTNIDFAFETPANLGERRQLVFASAEYPDMIQWHVSDLENRLLLDAVEDGIVLPVTEEVKAAENIQRYTNPLSWPALEITDDGEYYVIPANTIVRADGYFVRKDWLDNVGIELTGDHSVTLEEFTEILRRFTEEDPDGNGRDDTYGLTFGSRDGQLFLGIGWPFGVGRWAGLDWFRSVDGEAYPYMPLTYAKNHTNMIEALEYHRMIWEKGYIDPNWPTNTGRAAVDRLYSGVVGMSDQFGGHTYRHLYNIQQQNPDAEATYITGVTRGGPVEGPGFGSGLYMLHTVQTPGKEPVAVRWINWLLSDEGFELTWHGLEGLHFTRNTDGTRTYLPEYDEYAGWRTYLAKARRYNEPRFFMKANAGQAAIEQMTRWVHQCMENVVYSPDLGYRPPSASTQSLLDAKTELDVTISKIIVGRLPVDAWWDALENWYDAGGDAYLRDMNEYIARQE